MVHTKEDSTEEVKEELLTPSEYFNKMKDLMKDDSLESVKNIQEVALQKMKKYMVTGQKNAAKKLYDIAELAAREQKIVSEGFSKFVLRDDLENYIDKVADDAVCITELKDYDREIPDDIVDIIAKCSETELFDKYYVVFTDYTGSVRKNVEEERRSKDPILFGNLLVSGNVSDKMYYLGDWVDEMCDLTLEKMIAVMSKSYGKTKGKKIVHELSSDITLDDAKELLDGNLEVDPFDFTLKKTTKKSEKKEK